MQQLADDSGRQNAQPASYPHGRGYGHDYMRGGEIFGGYGYSERDEYERRRGEDRTDGTLDTGDQRHRQDGDHVS